MVINKTNFGGWAIGANLADWIFATIPPGSTIIELGSGVGSNELAKVYNLHCVEHDAAWCGKYPAIKYHYAPIVDGWFEPGFIEDMPTTNALLLIDAPPGAIGRAGFLNHAHKFNMACPVIVDDAHRPEELALATALQRIFKKQLIFVEEPNKKAAILL